MPKRKQQFNAFGSYVKELRKEMAKNGKFLKSKEMFSHACSKWKTLSGKEQEEYRVKAQKEKAEAKDVAADLPVVLNVHEIRRQKLIDEVKTLVDKISPAKVVEEKFYLISFNICCKVETDNTHIPVEVGLVEYSIEKGITNEYQKFIDPGKIPGGYRFSCIEKSEITHGIPFEKFEKASSDYKAILNDINKFTNKRHKLYTLSDDLLVLDYTEQTVSCLNWLAKCAGVEDDIGFKVYNVWDLFKYLMKIKGDDCDETTIKDYISTTVFDYQPKMGCEWHDAADKNKYCALALARKCGYIFSDNLCDMFEIEIINGKHLPLLEDNSVGIKSDDFKLSTSKMDDLTKRRVKRKKAANVIISTGKSSVFQPDSVDIYGKYV